MEEQFRIGGVYRNKRGHVVRLDLDRNQRSEFMAVSMREGGNPSGEAIHRLSDGANSLHRDCPQYSLIPGELEFRDGEWLPISVGAPVVEEKKEDETLSNGLTAEETDATASVMGLVTKTPIADLRDLVKAQGMDGTWNSDAYMVGLFNGLELALATMEGREPQYRTLKPAVAPQVTSTAHPPINGLSLSPDREGAGGDVRLGGRFGSVAVHAQSVFRSSEI